jgi:hypothetical protein
MKGGNSSAYRYLSVTFDLNAFTARQHPFSSPTKVRTTLRAREEVEAIGMTSTYLPSQARKAETLSRYWHHLQIFDDTPLWVLTSFPFRRDGELRMHSYRQGVKLLLSLAIRNR